MIRVTVKGGLGNQMFQYAFARSLAISMSTEVVVDTGWINTRRRRIVRREYGLDHLSVNVSHAEVAGAVRVAEPKMFRYAPELVESIVSGEASDVWLIDGYWQSYKYFEKHADVIAQEFTPKLPLPGCVGDIVSDIKESNSVLIHVRRADYVENPWHPCYGADHIDKCVALIAERVDNPRLFIFSDDIEWCRQNLSFPNSRFVDVLHDAPHHNMYMMSLCDHFVISASTFSWWSAWLGTYPNKIVIYPKVWFLDQSVDTSDLIPPSWISV